MTKVRDNEVRRAELSSSITELEKYNKKLEDEMHHLKQFSIRDRY